MMCAIWTPGIYLDSKTNKMKDLVAEIYRSKKNKCTYCGKIGAGLGCKVTSCSNTYHYLCAV